MDKNNNSFIIVIKKFKIDTFSDLQDFFFFQDVEDEDVVDVEVPLLSFFSGPSRICIDFLLSL